MTWRKKLTDREDMQKRNREQICFCFKNRMLFLVDYRFSVDFLRMEVTCVKNNLYINNKAIVWIIIIIYHPLDYWFPSFYSRMYGE